MLMLCNGNDVVMINKEELDGKSFIINESVFKRENIP